MVASEHLALTISGDAVSPRTIRLRDLIELLSDLERALMATAGAGRRAEELHISLVGLEPNLARLHLEADPRIRLAAMRISEAIAAKTGAILPQTAAANIADMHKRAVRKGWEVTINNGEFSSTMTPATPVFSDPLISGTTTVFGAVHSVGGRRPTARLDVEGGKLFTAEVANKDVAKQLGALLYKRVALHGEAWWYVSSMEMSRFRITGIGAFEEGASSPKDAFAELRELSGDLWDDVDPDKYVRNLRGESGE